eukprot:jgi/Galph1/114/GphlegSOOS_G4877.1
MSYAFVSSVAFGNKAKGYVEAYRFSRRRPAVMCITSQRCSCQAAQESLNLESFVGKKAVGVDYGLSRVVRLLLEKLSQIILSERAELIVVGFPLSTRGGEQTRIAVQFAQQVANIFWKLQVYLCDEKYTSIMANERLQDRGFNFLEARDYLDSEAAVILLERFFGGWGTDKSGVYVSLVRPAGDQVPSDVTIEKNVTKVTDSIYQSYRQWRQKLVKPED